ncbi:MAG: phosphoethanolamine transferase [Candidatus Delongbacteria bacterium]|nr:phosphoethanolamine transferase [Candidatus Delongbacteria bacterium]MCG2760320.1 phosphoethanolamine transferase [Candidatus Delongbacteria bacterium]
MIKKQLLNTLYYTVISTLIFISGDILYSFYNSNYSFIPNKRNMVYPLILFLALSMISKSSLRIFIIVLIMTSTLIHLLYYQYFGNYIQPIAFIQFFQNTGEVFESFLPEFVSMLIPIVIAVFTTIALIFTAKKFHGRLIYFRFSSYVFFFLVVMHLGIIYSYLNNSTGKLNNVQSRFIYPRPNRHSFENFMRSLNYFSVGIVPKMISGDFEKFPETDTPIIIEHNPDKNIVLIIGESLRGDRLSILGYNEKTTPKLDSLYTAEPFIKKIVFAGGTMTQTAFTALINKSKYPGSGKQSISNVSNLFKLAKENGFSTHFISKQSHSQLEIVVNLLSKQNIDFFAANSDLGKYISDVSKYDSDLLPMLKEIDLNKSNFIVLQQRGSHSPANNKYPDQYDKFKDPYDNSVLYTDHLISEVFKYLKENSLKETYLIFTSDHGELLGDIYGKKGHGWFEKGVLEVPYLFFAINNKDSVIYNQEKIKCHYDISTLMAGLLGYNAVIEDDFERTIYINGSEINALAGYMVVRLNGDNVISKEIIR